MRRTQGTYHGFLALTSLEGKRLATGDMVQVAHGDRVTSRLTFHFRDGSLDDETTVFTQHGMLRLVSDHHIQRGPSYPKPIDIAVDANGDVTSRDLNHKNVAGQVTRQHMDLPPDLSNGMQFIVLLNILPATPETKIPYFAPVGKGRVVQVSIKPEGTDPFMLVGLRKEAINYRLHVELGGLTGVIAPIIGKQPEDAHVWVLDGEAPSIVKVEAQLFEGGPIWRIELASPSWNAPATAAR